MPARHEHELKSAANAFQAVSTLYVGSLQRLAELNMSTMREAVEITASATQEIARARTPQDMQYALYQPMMECAQTYMRRFAEIVAQTQRELVDTVASGTRAPFGATGDWGSAFEAFSSGMRRFTMPEEGAQPAASEGGQQAAPGRPFGKKSA